VIGTADTLYTATTAATVSTIAVCNTSASAQSYRLAVHTATSYPATAAAYLVYGASVAANDSVFLTIGATLDTTNKYILCSASSSVVGFTAFGAEIS
jgi:hypothetical protein